MLITILHEITQIWTERKVLPPHFWKEELRLRKAHRIKQLFDYLRKTPDISDKEAEKFIYGEQTQAHAYRRLRDRLWNRLKSSVLSMDLRSGDNSKHLQAVYEVHLELFIARMLSMLGAKGAVVHIAHKALLKARKYHVTDAEFGLCVLLRNRAQRLADQSKFNMYNTMVRTALDKMLIEQDCEAKFDFFEMQYIRVTSRRNVDVIKQGKKDLEYVREMLKRFPTYQIYMVYFNFAIALLEVQGEYAKAITIAEEGLKYFEDHPKFRKGVLVAGFLQRIMFCSMHLHDYQRGRDCLDMAMKLMPVGSGAYHHFHRYFLQLCLTEEDFSSAEQTFRKLQSTGKLSKQGKVIQQEVKILHGYLFIASQLGLFQSQKPIRFTEDILQEEPIFNKDKHGYNLSILLLEMFLMIKNKEFDKASYRIDRLKTHNRRYLRNDENLRSTLFIRMLDVLNSKGFDPRSTRFAASPTRQKLIESGKNEDTKYDPAEIIRYELLWDSLLKFLERRPAHS